MSDLKYFTIILCCSLLPLRSWIQSSYRPPGLTALLRLGKLVCSSIYIFRNREGDRFIPFPRVLARNECNNFNWNLNFVVDLITSSALHSSHDNRSVSEITENLSKNRGRPCGKMWQCLSVLFRLHSSYNLNVLEIIIKSN